MGTVIQNRLVTNINILKTVAGLTLFMMLSPAPTFAQKFVIPGTGTKVSNVGDDFEDPNWKFIHNLPKASANIDKNSRHPSGRSNNARLLEGLYRGQPDVVERVATPVGGIKGSQGSLRMRSLNTGVPGIRTRDQQQDDLIINGGHGNYPVSLSPNFVCRVYVPPFEKWDQKTGSSFGFRADLMTHAYKKKKKRRSFFRMRPKKELEPYWPGMFIQFNRNGTTGKEDKHSAVIIIRGNNNGQDMNGPIITEPGWWTMGMSVTPDGQVHYFAKPGVENLTSADHLASSFPYGYRAEWLNTFFFNIVSRNDGRNWSTEWIVDDPTLYLHRR